MYIMCTKVYNYINVLLTYCQSQEAFSSLSIRKKTISHNILKEEFHFCLKVKSNVDVKVMSLIYLTTAYNA